MISIPLQLGTDPKNVVCELDVPHARFVVTGDEGQVLAAHETTSLFAYMFGRRLWLGVLNAMPPASAPRPGFDCDLCGRRCQDGEYAEWKMPAGRNAVIHHTCVVELVQQKRRERKSGQLELLPVGGGT